MPVHIHPVCDHRAAHSGSPHTCPITGTSPCHVQRPDKLLCTNDQRQQIKAMSNTPKNKRLKKQRLGDYKNLNWKLFKRHPKEKGKKAAEADSPNKVSLLTSSPPICNSCVWLHTESMPAQSDVSPHTSTHWSERPFLEEQSTQGQLSHCSLVTWAVQELGLMGTHGLSPSSFPAEPQDQQQLWSCRAL